jgi:hypothetical protein
MGKAADNERIKLDAMFYNNVAVGAIIVSVISGGIVTGVGGCGVELGGGVDGVCVAPALERGTTIPNSRIILSDDFPRSNNLTMGASS